MKTFKEFAKDLNLFFNSILPSYLTDNIADGAKLPYLTYDLVQNDYFENTLISCRIYSRSTSIVPLLDEVAKLETKIGEGTNYNGMWIYKGDPFVQFIQDNDNKLLKQAYINLVFRIY